MTGKMTVAVLGAGTMGRGIAQIAATKGHDAVVYDQSAEQNRSARQSLEKIFARLVEKGRMSRDDADGAMGRIRFTDDPAALAGSCMVVEAVTENLTVKRLVLSTVEKIVGDDCLIATNTSSLSVASIAAGCRKPERVVGMHFFNPAPLMALVEVIPAVITSDASCRTACEIATSWGKTPVVAKDTPGFIVNRVARPFYGEALRILEEGIADAATIDWAMKSLGGFRMGPFELMDLIGNDVNYAVTETVFEAFYYEPRYRPSVTQKRMVEANLLGRKTGRGFYDYAEGAEKAAPVEDQALGDKIMRRIRVMLINEAADAVFWKVASQKDIDLAMTLGVNYPKGLLAWANEIGLEKVLSRLRNLRDEYEEARYRPSPILKKLVEAKQWFSPGEEL